MLRIVLRTVALVALIALLTFSWWLFIHTAPPGKRPDLVRLPDTLGPPPAGYPTEGFLYGAFALSELGLYDLDLVDPGAEAPLPEGVIEEKDIEYGTGGGKPLQLDLYSPANLTKPVPGVIFIHGGGWRSGKRQDYKMYTTRFAKQGYVAATVSYRLREDGYFPNCVEDVKCAVRWMRANAERINVDPNRIAVIGGSAGGHLSMMVGYSSDIPEFEGNGGNEGVSSAVQAVIDIYGPADFSMPENQDHPLLTNFMQGTYEEIPEKFIKGSPITYLDVNDPPTLIIHGTIDSLVPVEQSDRLAERFQAMGKDYWYDRLDGWPHAMDVANVVNKRVEADAIAFLAHVFGDPAAASTGSGS